MFADDGCPGEDINCGVNDVEGLKCGPNGTCIGSFHEGEYVCSCKPGWRGPKCSVRKYHCHSINYKTYPIILIICSLVISQRINRLSILARNKHSI